MAAFPEAWMNELLARNDIVSVISQYVQLKPKGRNLWGLCPFHGEKTPSFSVAPEKQLFYCFGCHVGGGVIQFVMQIERLSFFDAVKYLADRVNLPLPDAVDDESIQRERRQKERMHEACREAAMFFHQALKSPEGRDAQAYLARRGVSPKTAVHFGLGFAPAGWDHLKKYLLSKGYQEEELIQCGLLNKKGDRSYDSFRGRVMFPIIGNYQKVIGFGARAMGDEQPKYLNTQETPIFNKRANLYGLNLMRGKNIPHVIVVEGYMDVVSLHQAGVETAVASLGTALTQQQARLIKRYTSNVYICYDGDSAGQNATIRGLEILSAEGLNVRVIALPDGLDPDEFIKERGLGAFEEQIANAFALNAFKLKAIAARHDLMSADGREACAKEGCAMLAALSPIERERYCIELARLTGFSPQALEAQIAGIGGLEVPTRNSPPEYRNNRNNQRQEISSRRCAAERMLLKAALSQPELLQSIDRDIFHSAAHKNLAGMLASGQNENTALLFSDLPEEEAQAAAAVLAMAEPRQPEQAFSEALAALGQMDLEEEIHQLQKEADREETPTQRRMECARRIRELNAQLSKIGPYRA